MDHQAHYRPPEAQVSDRKFGWVFTIVFLVVALWPLLHGRPPAVWALGVAAAFALLAAVFPRLLAPLRRLWMAFGLLLHHVVSPVAMGLVFFFVIAPAGLLMRVLGKDPLRLRYEPSSDSYWIRRQPPGPAPDSLERPF